MNAYFLAFQIFAATYCPGMPREERQLLPVGIWEGTRDPRTACTFTGICEMESQLQVRKWYPEVKQNMDVAGSHNNLLFQELKVEGVVNDAKDWRKSLQWRSMRALFQQRPDIGTLFAARAFTRLADKFGLDNAVQMWKTGKTGTVPGLLYLMNVRLLRDAMLKSMYPARGKKLRRL